MVNNREVNKTITIVGRRGIMTPTMDKNLRKEAVSVEIRPNERWIGNATIPLRAFQIFNLPQDSGAYAERTCGELADRCLSRAGRVQHCIYFAFPYSIPFLFPLNLLLYSGLISVFIGFYSCAGGFQGSFYGVDNRNDLETKLVAVKEEKMKLKERIINVERRASEIVKFNFTFLTQVFLLS